MNVLFADTSFFVAVFSPQDALHARAKEAAAAQVGLVVTTEFVLIEVGNFFCRGNARNVFRTMIEQLQRAEDFEMVPASAALFRDGLALFNARPDKEWSLTDCTSFVVMQARGIRAALTADHHFKQAGFDALLS